MTPEQIEVALWLLKASGVFVVALAVCGYLAYKLLGGDKQ